MRTQPLVLARRLLVRPAAADACWVTLLVLLVGPLAARVDGWHGLLGLALTSTPLVLRRRYPLAVFGAVVVLGAVTFTLLAARQPTPLLPVLVAVATVAVHRPVRTLIAVVTVSAVVLVPVVLIISGSLVRRDGAPVPLWAAIGSVFGLLATATAVGSNTRIRRAHLAGLTERARALEVERDQRTRLAVAAERNRITSEMHDVVAHSLTVMVTLADGMAARAAALPDRPPDSAALHALSATGREALGEVRRLLGVLGEGSRTGTDAPRPQPGAADLDHLLERVRGAGVFVTITRAGSQEQWDRGTGLTVYRIVQEALTNTLKHAGPGAHAQVLLRTEQDRVEVEVIDDGGGRHPRPPTADGPGRGLTGMAERAATYDGHLRAGPREGAGWKVQVVLALHTTPAAS